jgi:hypothetical protein
MEVIGAFFAGLVSCLAVVLWILLDTAQHRLPPEDLRALRRAVGGGPLNTRNGPAGSGVRLVMVPLPDATYPMLQMIDETRGKGFAPFAEAPCAAWLEQCARELMLQDSSGDFDDVCAALERERQAQESGIRKIRQYVDGAERSSSPSS